MIGAGSEPGRLVAELAGRRTDGRTVALGDLERGSRTSERGDGLSVWITQRAPERGYSSGIDSLRVVTHWRLFCLFIRLFSVPYSFVLVPVISCEKNGGDRSVAYVVVVQLVPVVSRTIPETDTRLTLRVAIRNRQIFSKPSFGRSCVRNRIRAPTIIGSFLTSPNFLTRSRRFPAIGVLARVDGLFAT